MIGILGSGFGLYGHLPAWVELGYEVILLERRRPDFEARLELHPYAAAVRFAPGEDELLSNVQIAVLARRPSDNLALARNIMGRGRPGRVVIEKPPAATPGEAAVLLNEMEAHGLRYAIPYLLIHCPWADQMKAAVAVSPGGHAALDWRFHSPTVTADSWKSAPDLGGGPLSYYLIHAIALGVFVLGEDATLTASALSRAGDVEETRLTFSSGLGTLSIQFASGSVQSLFAAAIDGTSVFTAQTPFGATPRRGERDPRIDVLKRFYRAELISDQPAWPVTRDENILRLWAQARTALPSLA